MRPRPAAARLAAVATVLAFATLMVPGTHAALNGARPYEADVEDFGYMPGLGGPQFTMASGRMDAVVPDGEGTWGFFATGGTTVSGLTRVCWTATLRQCADSPGGRLAIEVLPGGSFGVQFPAGADATLEARHALGLFVDLGSTGDLNSLDLGLSLVAPLVEGQAVFTSVPAIPAVVLTNPMSQEGGALAATEDATVVEVRDGETLLVSQRGKVDPFTFTGEPDLTPIDTELAVVPFRGGEAVARFQAAAEEDAKVGLDIARVNRLMARLYAANEGSATDAEDIEEGAFGPFQDAAAALFGGSVLSLPTGGEARSVAEGLSFARTPRLEVRGTPADGLSWTGTATLDVRDGNVQGAQPLHGLGLVALPWWGWLLWIAALTVWIVRLVRKPEKKNPKWDRYKWIGWVASLVVALLLFILWDFETRAVLGLSLLSGHATGQVLVLVAALQLGTLGLLSFAAVAPLRLLLRNGSLLLGQGTFMGLAGAAAGVLGYLIGAWTILRSGLDLFLGQLLKAIA